MSDGGKGSAPRPFSVSQEQFASNFDLIFGKAKFGNRCKKCGGEMKPGIAMGQTATGLPDFPGDKHCVTVSAGGPGVLIDCMKCVDCGFSTTEGSK